MRKIVFNVVICCSFLISCSTETKPWVFEKKIEIEGVNPIGIVEVDQGLWLSDGDHNRLILIDKQGKALKTIGGLSRPMHIDQKDNEVYVPEYGKDEVTVFGENSRYVLPLNETPDAPAGVAVFDDEIAVVDFYNNRILYSNGEEWISFGKEGKKEGEFYYPTDIQIVEKEIYVADAYNNRIQVFDKKGTFKRMIGASEKMNAATGMFVSNDEVFVTDFENDRVLVFKHNGELKQILKGDVKKPIDALIVDDALYIINYREGSISIFRRD